MSSRLTNLLSFPVLFISMLIVFLYTIRDEYSIPIKGYVPDHNYDVGDGIPHDIDHSTYLVKEMLRILSYRYKNRALNYIAEKLLTHTHFMNEKQMKDIDYVAGCLFTSNNHYQCPVCPPSIRHLIPHSVSSLTQCKLPEYFPEVVVFHHGLKFAEPYILDYIKDRDIVDAGAFVGDSACVLSPYTKGKIYSYEISNTNFRKLQSTIQNNGLQDKVIPYRKGLASKKGILHLDDTGNSGTKIQNNGREGVDLVTVDEEARRHNMTVGFMKADCEGFDLEVLKGAADVIRRDRPIISFQTYHNFEEFFGIPEFIMSFPNYMYYFRVEGINRDALGEYGILAFPAEIVYPTYTPSQMDEIKNFPGINISEWKAF